ncbi:hypothetical protein ACFUMH_01740 [Cellulomonas sp. NPDC057328]|uniref:hypothetical protein n=1 Tax=Cellulomonas sp. NPDC057328 TaxID=3346101 RepID=UPI00362E012E
MGYFAVLAPQGASKDQLPRVSKCHLNLWSLPGLGSRRLLYFDVGVELATAGLAISDFRLLLPFRIEEGKWPDGTSVVQDLQSHVVDQDTAELVFGGPVRIEQSAGAVAIYVGDYAEPVNVVRVNASQCEVSEDLKSREDSTLVRVVLQQPVGPNSRAYVRLRFRVFGSAPLWRWSRSSGGAEVDFRLYDVRESSFAEQERHLRDVMLEVDVLNIFVMAPSRLVVAARSPEFRYVRRLETGAWLKYLKGATFRGSGDRIAVYYWRHRRKTEEDGQAKNGATNPDNPFRILLSLHRPQARSWYSLALLNFVGVMLAWGAVRLGGWVLASDIHLDLASLKGVLVFVFGASLASVIAAYERLRGWASGRFIRPRSTFRRAERWILSVKPGG